MRNVDFFETGFTGETDFVVAGYSETKLVHRETIDYVSRVTQ
jgi:hypothetical protein